MLKLYKKRILIVDSSDAMRAILFKELHARLPDIDIIACSTAKEALTAAKRFEFEIITTSLALPDMNGYDLISNVRQIDKNRDTAIFVISGDTNTDIITDSEDDTAVTAYFDKSEGHKALVNFICNFLGKEDLPIAKVLYIDQSATSTAITSSILEKNNFSFVHIKDGETALSELRRDQQENEKCSYDVVITDLTLNTEMTGFELIQAIRNDIKYDYLELPILIMTVEPGSDEKTDFTGIFGAGSNDFITKPITEEKLVERVVNLINVKRQNDALNALR